MAEDKQFITTVAQLDSHLDQILDELDDLLQSIEYEEVEEFGPHRPLYESLKLDIINMKAALADGTLPLGTGKDMPWLKVVNENKWFLPFYFPLKQINLAQKNGVYE